jgi:hypothetical protein
MKLFRDASFNSSGHVEFITLRERFMGGRKLRAPIFLTKSRYTQGVCEPFGFYFLEPMLTSKGLKIVRQARVVSLHSTPEPV